MDKNTLNLLIGQGLSTYDIAQKLNCSQTNIRHWLKKFNLKTKADWFLGNKTVRYCPRCKTDKPLDQFYKRRNGEGCSVYCKPCTNNQTVERQQALKQQCVAYKGGKCQICDYNKYLGALEFHHTNPKEKDFNISKIKSSIFTEKIQKELDKCALLCATCHREVHGGFASLVVPTGVAPV